jgi:hypothetical protein
MKHIVISIEVIEMPFDGELPARFDLARETCIVQCPEDWDAETIESELGDLGQSICKLAGAS